jgi:hypothetical protein
MRLALCSLALIASLVVVTSHADAQENRPTPVYVDLPIPDHDIPCNIGAWRGSFTLLRMDYEKKDKDRQIVFLLRTERKFTFGDDGFTATLRFLDEDNVNMVEGKNLRFANDITKLRIGDVTRLYLTLPDEGVLNKTKKCEAVNKGFFTDPDKKKDPDPPKKKKN